MANTIRNPLAYLKPAHWPKAIALGLGLTTISRARHLTDDIVESEPLARRQLASQKQAPAPGLPSEFLKVQSPPGEVPFLGYDSRPQVIAGFNIFTPPSGADAACGTSVKQFSDALADVRANASANTIRMWFFQSTAGPGRWEVVDRTLDLSREYGLHIIAVFGNQWSDCDAAENGTATFKDITWYESGYKRPQNGYRYSYRDYVASFVERYATEPQFAAFEFINEALAGTLIRGDIGTKKDSFACPDESAAAAALQSFTSDMVAVVRKLDSSHLLTMGTRSGDDCGVNRDNYMALINKGLDFCQLHSYGMPRDEVDFITSACLSANKPLLFGEVAEGYGNGTKAATTAGEQLLQAHKLVDDFTGYIRRGASGFLLWHYDTSSTPDGFSVMAGSPVLPAVSDFVRSANERYFASPRLPAVPEAVDVDIADSETDRFGLSSVSLANSRYYLWYQCKDSAQQFITNYPLDIKSLSSLKSITPTDFGYVFRCTLGNTSLDTSVSTIGKCNA